MRFFAVTKKELKSIPCSRFRESNSQYGPVPRWYLRLHVQCLSIETWKTKATSNRKSYKNARKSGQLLSPHPSSPSYIPSYIHTNRRELKLEASTRSTSFVFKSKNISAPTPLINSAVSGDIAFDIEPDRVRLYQLSYRTRRRKRGRPVTEGSGRVWLKEFTVS